MSKFLGNPSENNFLLRIKNNKLRKRKILKNKGFPVD